MQPHLEEAWRALQLADRDIAAFRILSQEPEAHLSIVCFHAQQAVEKSLKAVLFSRRIEFRRIHDLTELTELLRQYGIETPVHDDLLGLEVNIPLGSLWYNTEELEKRANLKAPLLRSERLCQAQNRIS